MDLDSLLSKLLVFIHVGAVHNAKILMSGLMTNFCNKGIKCSKSGPERLKLFMSTSPGVSL